MPLYYWRDLNGRIEVYCIIDTGESSIPIEIKASEIVTKEHYGSLLKFDEIAELDKRVNYIVYTGPYNQKLDKSTLVSWNSAGDLIAKIEKEEK